MSARASAPAGASRTEFAGTASRGEYRRLLWCMAIALVLHQPLMASSLFSWIRVLFREQPTDVEDMPDQDVLLSVELDEGLFDDDPDPSGGKQAGAVTPAGAGEDGDGILLLDGGVPDDDDEDDDDEDDDDDFGGDDDDDDDGDDDDDDAADPADAGAPEPDAGIAAADAGAPLPDAGALDDPDAGLGLDPDAGAPEPDAGLDPDAGIAKLDPPDAGPLPSPTGSAIPAMADGGLPSPGDTPDAGPDIYDMDPPDAGPPPEPRAKVGPPVRDPNSLAGAAGTIRPTHSNVRIYIAADVLRRHKLAPMFGDLLNAVPEWKALLGGTGLDPIHHFDHLLITGPQMRNPSWIVATMDYNISNDKMRAAVDKVIARSAPDGKWLPEDEHPVPVAAIGKKGFRRVALVEKHKLLVVMPKGATKQLKKLDKVKPFRKNRSTGIALFVKYPHRAVRGFALPNTLRWMKLRLKFHGADGFHVQIDALDKTPEDAAKTARRVERDLEALRKVPGSGLFGLTKEKFFFGKPTFKVKGKMIHASAELTHEQVDRIMFFAMKWLEGSGAKKGTGK